MTDTPEADEGATLEEFTAREALAFGAEFVAAMKPTDTTAALAVAEFLMQHAPAVYTLDADYDEGEEGMPVGPIGEVRCVVSPTDLAQVVGLKSGHVGLRFAGEEGAGVTMALTVKDARGFAAAILNAADDADGSSPLLMFRSPEGGPDVTPQAA